jgi:hypothetical protein
MFLEDEELRPSQRLNEPFTVKRKQILFKKNGIPPLCFTCGNELPEKDFEDFHNFCEVLVEKGNNQIEAEKLVLDGYLSKIYPRVCCRLMFQGDPIEFRKNQAFYKNIDV